MFKVPRPSIPRPSTPGRRRAVQALLLLALVGGLLPGRLAPAGAAGAAPEGAAVPPRCEDGSPPPCGDDPEPPTTRPRPIPTNPPTTFSPPTTTGTTVPPQAPPWSVNVVPLVEDPGGLTGTVQAERFWIPHLVNAPANAVAAQLAGGGNSIFDPIPAGTATLSSTNTLTFPGMALPSGYEMVLRVREQGSSGALCRTTARTALPASGRPLHILAAPPLTTGGADLQAMVGGFTGPVEGLDPSITATVTAVTITPQADGLSLRTQGNLTIVVNGTPFKFTFDHTMVFTLVPSIGPDLSYVLVAQSANAGTAVVEWDQVPPPGGDGLLALIRDGLPGQIRPKVLQKATTQVNSHIHGLSDVRWWSEQGFYISVRKVGYSTAGLTVFPSFCRLG
jgi:hypothetical protein